MICRHLRRKRVDVVLGGGLSERARFPGLLITSFERF